MGVELVVKQDNNSLLHKNLGCKNTVFSNDSRGNGFRIIGGREVSSTAINGFLLGIVKEIMPLMRHYKLWFSGGIVFRTYDEAALIKMKKNLMRMGCVEKKKLGGAKEPVCYRNYQFLIHTLGTKDKLVDICDFLEEEQTTPVLLVAGTVPEELRQKRCVVFFEWKDVDYLEKTWKESEFVLARAYMRSHPELVQRELSLFHTSLKYHKGDADFITTLKAGLNVYSCFCREKYPEQEVVKVIGDWEKAIEQLSCVECDYSEQADMLEAVRREIRRYLLKHLFSLGSMKNMDDKIRSKCMCKNAVLYDDDWYYFPEEVLRAACQALTPTISFQEIKRMLADNGMLYLNNTKTFGFTVKKTINDLRGEKRYAFIAVKKDSLVDPGELFFEERRRD